MTVPASGRVSIVCPRCRGSLAPAGSGDDVACTSCNAVYPVVAGVPDLRLSADPFLTAEEDRAAAVRLTQAALPFPELLASYYEQNALVPPAQARAIVRATLAATDRARTFLAQAQRLCRADGVASLRVLDVGTGTGPLAVELANRGADVYAVDIGMRWIVLARARAADAGARLGSCCSGIEALPFAEASFDLVTGESVLEWIPDQLQALREVRRVLRPGGRMVIATPNRWSLGPDPHLGIPLTSWLPQRAVSALARWRGMLPPSRRLLSRRQARRLFNLAGFRLLGIEPPELPASVGAGRPAWFRAGVATYRHAMAVPVVRGLAGGLAPLLVIAAERPA